jgi:1-acyl-sn-glycerol-3-phosphate acyltransferase
MNIRAVGGLILFALKVVVSIFDHLFTSALASEKSRRLSRARWLHRNARRHLKTFGYTADISGDIPKHGLLISNHLSYLDIPTIAATTPAVFVSKADVRRWPVIGWLAKMGGTIFIERERRLHVGAVNEEIESALAAGVLVVVFPEGTSSNGETVLPFRSSLLEPATRGGNEISVAWLHYELKDGDARKEVCYWDDHTFFPHLLNLLGKKSVHATLRFAKFHRTTTNRKELAKQLHAAVQELKEKNRKEPLQHVAADNSPL